MGPKPQCYIPRPKVIFEGFLPYISIAVILVMWPRCPEQTFVPPTYEGSTWNLASIGPAVLEKKIFENGGRTTDGRTTDGRRSKLYYKLTNEPKVSGDLKRNKWKAKGTALSQTMATINWTVSQKQTESGRTLTIRINYNRSIALERPVINYMGLEPV